MQWGTGWSSRTCHWYNWSGSEGSSQDQRSRYRDVVGLAPARRI